MDRLRFASYITEKIRSCPLIDVVEEEAVDIPKDEITVIATGPLTSDAMARQIIALTGQGGLSFFDAAAPIVDFASIDMSRAFFASRYGKGDADYINCPMNEAEYKAFYDALIHAEEAKLHDFEADAPLTVFEGCMPVEVMAKRGEDTLRFGPMKPVGIRHPETGESYYAVVQLRREDEVGTMFNLVGFQTHLTFPEQRRVFSMIPGLENAEFLRYGVMHRNTFLNSPELLDADYSLRSNPRIFFAGQMTGVEGYIESAASGYVAGLAAACRAKGEDTPIFPKEPILTIRAPAIEAQLIETFLLLSINHQSLIATKANRVVRAAEGRKVLEFGSRRAQGADAAILGARAAYIGGAVGTACALDGRDYGIPALGTMAHSWVQMFDTELDAFLAYAKEYPQYACECNKGYGTAAHIQGIKEHGLCPIHRRTFTKKF